MERGSPERKSALLEQGATRGNLCSSLLQQGAGSGISSCVGTEERPAGLSRRSPASGQDEGGSRAPRRGHREVL